MRRPHRPSPLVSLAFSYDALASWKSLSVMSLRLFASHSASLMQLFVAISAVRLPIFASRNSAVELAMHIVRTPALAFVSTLVCVNVVSRIQWRGEKARLVTAPRGSFLRSLARRQDRAQHRHSASSPWQSQLRWLFSSGWVVVPVRYAFQSSLMLSGENNGEF